VGRDPLLSKRTEYRKITERNARLDVGLGKRQMRHWVGRILRMKARPQTRRRTPGRSGTRHVPAGFRTLGGAQGRDMSGRGSRSAHLEVSPKLPTGHLRRTAHCPGSHRPRPRTYRREAETTCVLLSRERTWRIIVMSSAGDGRPKSSALSPRILLIMEFCQAGVSPSSSRSHALRCSHDVLPPGACRAACSQSSSPINRW
jgi:hypothetical protein